MPGAILHVGATVLCSHGGTATPSAPSARVAVSGQFVTTVPGPYMVAGCGFPPNSGGPCVSATWSVGATRVLVEGKPVIINTGQATCVPTGTPLMPAASQTRVIAM